MKRNNLINKYYNWIGIEHESMIKKLFYIFRLLLVILYLLFSVYIFPFWLTIFLVVGPILSYGFLKYFRIFPIFSKKSFSPFSDEHGPLTEKESIEKISGLIDIMSEGLPNYKSEKIDNEDGSYTLIQYYDNGKESSVSIYKDGGEHGLQESWYENGQKWNERNFKNGKRDGLYLEWYENGQKYREEKYRNGKEVGKWTYWNEDGTIKEVIEH